MKLLYLSKYISKMNATQQREALISGLRGKQVELNSTRATLATTIDEIFSGSENSGIIVFLFGSFPKKYHVETEYIPIKFNFWSFFCFICYFEKF